MLSNIGKGPAQCDDRVLAEDYGDLVAALCSDVSPLLYAEEFYPTALFW